MRLPSRSELDRLEAEGEGAHRAWHNDMARLRHHVELERLHPSLPDGYPTSTTAGGGVAELTSVEADVVARAQHCDQHRSDTLAAWAHALEHYTHSLAFNNRVRLLDTGERERAALASENDAGCSNHRRFGRWAPRAATGVQLCDWCYAHQRKYQRLP